LRSKFAGDDAWVPGTISPASPCVSKRKGSTTKNTIVQITTRRTRPDTGPKAIFLFQSDWTSDTPIERQDKGLDLLQFHQAAVKVFGMQEKHRLAVGPDLGFSAAQHARALRQQMVAGGQDVIDLIADVVNAA